MYPHPDIEITVKGMATMSAADEGTHVNQPTSRHMFSSQIDSEWRPFNMEMTPVREKSRELPSHIHYGH